MPMLSCPTACLAAFAITLALALPSPAVHAVSHLGNFSDAIGPIKAPPGVSLPSTDCLTLVNLDLTSPTPLAGSAEGWEHLLLTESGAKALGKSARGQAPGNPDVTTAPPLPDHEVVPRIYLYTVQPGDTLWDIAQEHGVSVITLMGANPEVSAWRLQVGESIRILSVDGVIHEIEAGDTIAGLADEYDVDLLTIIQANSLDDPEALVAGREIIIPGAEPDIVHTVTVASGGQKYATSITGDYLWPVYGTITSHYGWRWGRMHTGLDIGAPHGTTIVASRAGLVTRSGWYGGYGYTVVLDHGDGITTLYAHVSTLLVSYGQWVEAGQAIARVGSTGYSTGPHLHFEVRVNGGSVDPLDVLP